MDTSIRIVNGKRGYHLKVNGMYISQGFQEDINSIKCTTGIPYGATEWVSVKAIRNFWHKYMPMIILASTRPCTSLNGILVTKHIEYAYPSSDIAQKAGKGKTGCYFVSKYLAQCLTHRLNILNYFDTAQEAKCYADALEIEYHFMEKYNSHIHSCPVS